MKPNYQMSAIKILSVATAILCCLGLNAQNNYGIRNENLSVTVNGITFEMVKVEGGSFYMGCQSENPALPNYYSSTNTDESPVHHVVVSSFYIGQCEVTTELWSSIMGNTPSYFIGDKKPVEQVSWEECQQFIEELSTQTGYTFRLPTEAEWEYAARGGAKSEGYTYSGSDVADEVAWYFSVSNWLTHEVGTKAPNELGIYDMSGNVWEWVSDWYDEYTTDTLIDPLGPDTGTNRVARGGSWFDEEFLCRVSPRASYRPTDKGLFLGFRLAMSCTSTSLDEADNTNLTIYPNPASDFVNIGCEVRDVVFYDMTGRLVLHAIDDCIDVSKLDNGLYLCRVTDDNGVVTTRKIQIRH